MHAKIVLVLSLAALCLAPIAHAESYIGPAQTTNCAGGIHTGSTCVKVPAGATQVTPYVNDAVFGAEAGQIAFVQNTGGTPPTQVFCPGTTFDIPAGTTKVIVTVATPDAAFNTCGLVGAGTTGDLGATFS